MHGPWIDALIIGVALTLVIFGSAHLWGPPLGRSVKRIGKSLNIAGEALFKSVQRILGQGRTRPQNKGK